MQHDCVSSNVAISCQGIIPSEIGLLANLISLRLSYNFFIGTVPSELEQLQSLALLHLHSNRLTGNLSLPFLTGNESSFISDCGLPASFELPILCESCSMCCNSQHNCFFKGAISIKEAGFEDYEHLSWVFLLSIAAVCVISHTILFMYKQFKGSHQSNPTDHQEFAATLEEEKRYAKELIGEDSVYRYFLNDSWWGWCIALASIVVQIWMCYEFVYASEYEFESSTSDLEYTWTCPRDEVDCRNTDGMVKKFG